MLDSREARGLRAFDTLQQRLRYAARILRKQPAFTATALATLAITVGANLAIFAIVDVVLLRPLPFRDAGSPRRDLQHVPESRRPGRWRVGDELLRAPACHRRADERVALSGRRRHRRRSRRDRARVRDPRHAGVLRDAGRASRSGARLHGRGHGIRRDLHGRTCRHRDRRLLARPPRRRFAGARPRHPNGRRARRGDRRVPAGVPASCRRRAGSTCRSRRGPTPAVRTRGTPAVRRT